MEEGSSATSADDWVESDMTFVLPPTDLPSVTNTWYGEQHDESLPFLHLATTMSSFDPLTAGVPDALPSNAAEVNDMIAGWLDQDMGALTAERSLAAIFASPDSGIVPGPTETAPFAQTNLDSDQTPESPRLRCPSPQRPPKTRRRTVLAADTWELGIPVSASDNTISRAQSPQQNKFTSPDQVVGELTVDGPDVSAS